MNFQDTRNAIFSRESAGGPSPSASPVGEQIDLFGQEAAHANHSVVQGDKKEKTTNATYGPNSTDSSENADHIPCSVSKFARWRSLEGNKKKDAEYQRQYRLKNRAKDLMRHARFRATKKGLPFDLDQHLSELQRRINNGFCEISGIPFNLDGGRTWDSPSFDRIDSSAGYTYCNVRVVLHAVNSAMGDWGEAKMLEIARAIMARRTNASNSLSERLGQSLMKQLDGLGAPEYELTWKRSVTPSGHVIYRQRASALRTSGNGCSGWPTPDCSDRRSQNSKQKGVGNVAKLAGWPTPNAMEGGQTSRGGKRKGEMLIGGLVAGWPTPCGQDGPHGGPNQGTDRLPGAAGIAGWSTPCAQDAKHAQFTEYEKQKIATTTFNLQLYQQADLAGWATPAARDWKSESATDDFNAKRSGHPRGKPLSYQVTLSGQIPFSSPAETGKRGVLAPDLPRWLMGYPEEHLAAGMKAISKR